MVEKYQKEINDIEDRNRKENANKWFDLNNQISRLETNNKKLKQEINELKENNDYQRKIIELKQTDIAQLSKKYKDATGAKGGLTKRVNELLKQIKEKDLTIKNLNEKLKMRYILTELKPEKAKKQTMQLYSKRRTSNIIKKVQE